MFPEDCCRCDDSALSSTALHLDSRHIASADVNVYKARAAANDKLRKLQRVTCRASNKTNRTSPALHAPPAVACFPAQLIKLWLKKRWRQSSSSSSRSRSRRIKPKFEKKFVRKPYKQKRIHIAAAAGTIPHLVGSSGYPSPSFFES